MNIIGLDEDLPVKNPSIYPTIDPQQFYAPQTFKDKVVLITGASRGIGRETALHYARAGAALVLVSRTQETLDAAKSTILTELPGARVLTYAADVRDVGRAQGAVRAAVDAYGRLDVLVANAGTIRPESKRASSCLHSSNEAQRTVLLVMAETDPAGWWEVHETNVRGTFNFVHGSLPELVKTKGRIVIVTSVVAQLRVPTVSDYCTSKHTLGRLAEHVAVEYPDLKVFCVHPGVVETDMTKSRNSEVTESVALPAATLLFLTAGKADYLSGRYVSATWDLGEVERDWKEKIVEQNGLVSKLYIPK
ncbi:hypothetical protein BC834DRAFT_1014534 [Gloeopeniophorella convolvens]|nr:hypothetical protein BC834DRAFT_1014534 [Gloeopeniophorella convolvens]